MKYTITHLDEENEPVAFTDNIWGNYSSESFFGSFPAQSSPFPIDSVTSQIEKNSQTNLSRCVNIVELFVNNSHDLFWNLYFDGLKSSYGARAGCILVSPNGEKTILSCKLEFESMNNVAENEAIAQGIQKAISIGVNFVKVFCDSKIVVKQVHNSIHCVSNHLKHY